MKTLPLLIFCLICVGYSAADDEDYDENNSGYSSAMGHHRNRNFDEYNNRHVAYLNFYSCDSPMYRLEKLPMKSMRSFALRNCGVAEIADDAFDNVADSLEELDLSGNILSKMPDLNKLPKLKKLTLNNNHIRDISNGVKQNTSTVFNIVRLEIARNGITVLTKSTFSQFKNLKVLDISYNPNLRISPDAFSSLKLRELSMNANGLTKLPLTLLKSLPSLKTLSLDGNRVKDLPPNAFSTMQNLTSISLRKNKLTALPNGIFKDLRNLKKIDLKFNRIRLLPTKVFSGLNHLEFLDLSQNKLTQLQTGLLSESDSMTDLRLDHNEINEIDRNSLPPLEKMTIDLRSNKLRTLGIDSFVPLGNSSGLREYHDEDFFKIWLSGNPLECDKRLAWLVESFIPTPHYKDPNVISFGFFNDEQPDPHSDNPLCEGQTPGFPLKNMKHVWGEKSEQNDDN